MKKGRSLRKRNPNPKRFEVVSSFLFLLELYCYFIVMLLRFSISLKFVSCHAVVFYLALMRLQCCLVFINTVI